MLRRASRVSVFQGLPVSCPARLLDSQLRRVTTRFRKVMYFKQRSSVKTKLSTDWLVRGQFVFTAEDVYGMAASAQCPLSARSVPAQCPLSARLGIVEEFAFHAIEVIHIHSTP